MSPPVTPTEVAGFTARLGAELAVTPEPIVGPLSADGAVARAVRFNHSIRAKELEAALADAKVRSQGGAMLPTIVAESDYYRRDRPLASSSNQSSTYSSSTDLTNISRDIALSWNILDFGLSYVRTRQSLDKAHQQHEEARRVRARIVEETRSLYWRAVALELLTPAMSRLDREVAEAIQLSRRALDALQVDPMTQITFQRDMLNMQRELNQLDSSLAGATSQLKITVGVPLDAPLHLRDERRPPPLTDIALSADDDVRVGLAQRPEIRQHMYDLRITDDEIKATILQVLPGVTLTKTFASDSNPFLLNANWISWGTRIAGNLIGLVRLPGDLQVIEGQKQAHRQNALATGATIAMQIYVARARIAVLQRAYRDAERFAESQHQLLRQVATAVKLGKLGQQALTREKLATLQADVRGILAFAELHAAYAAHATARGDELPDAEPPANPLAAHKPVVWPAKADIGQFLIMDPCLPSSTARRACDEPPPGRLPSL